MNEKRWEQLLALVVEYTDPFQVQRGVSAMTHIYDECETLEDLLEALETDELPRYAALEMYENGEDMWYMPEGYQIIMLKDHREIEDHIKEELREGTTSPENLVVYDLDGSMKEVKMSVALNPSVLVLDKE
jgi:hypothetical protein